MLGPRADRRRGRRGVSDGGPPPWVLPALLIGLAGCASRSAAFEGAEPPALPRLERRAIDPAFVAAFEALQTAVGAGEDATARAILDGILARRPPPRLERLAREYERILDGRELVRALVLGLSSEPVEGSAIDYRLVLTARHDWPSAVRFVLPPGTLRRTTVALDPAGNESRSMAMRTTSALSEITVPPGEGTRVELLDYELALGGSLAVRERWTLELRSGVLQVEGERYPAASPPVEGVERLSLAPFLPAPWVEPGELARYVREEEIRLPPLIERAVRIDPARRAEALDLLAPVVVDLLARDPERVERITPALRWLARTSRPTGAAGWAGWLRDRLARRRAEERRRQRLVLPGGEGAGAVEMDAE